MRKFFAVSLALVSAALAIAALAAPAPRSTLQGSKPSWATPQNYVGAANARDQLGFRVYLGWNNASGAEALARAVSDPRSRSYRHYLTPNQFRAQFAPTASEVAQVQGWLTSQGFTLVYTPRNNHYVSAQGTVGQAQAAFGASFGKYRVRGLGLTLRAPSADVSIPSSLAALVSGVAGLDESYELIRPTHSVDANAPPSEGFRNSPPFSTFWGQLTSPYAYPFGGGVGGANPTYAPWNVRNESRGRQPPGAGSPHGFANPFFYGLSSDANIVYVGAPNNYQDLDAFTMSDPPRPGSRAETLTMALTPVMAPRTAFERAMTTPDRRRSPQAQAGTT